MALLWLAAKVYTPARLVALTVDHGLRADAAKEAETVARWCADQGIEHHTLRWEGAKPETGVQAAARDARYQHLVRACYDHGIQHLLTAHHADDQAETVFARLARGSGHAGLSGMRPCTKMAVGAATPVSLWRPLLAVSGDQLKATARDNNLPVAADPSNDDPQFERVRRRAFLAATSVQGFLSSTALQQTATRLAETSDLAAQQLQADFSAARGLFHGSGAIAFDLVPFRDLSPASQQQLINHAIYAVSAASQLPEVPLPDFATTPNGPLLTHSGAIVQRHDNKLWVMREPAALLGRKDGTGGIEPVTVAPGNACLWDKRFCVYLPADAPEGALELRPIGQKTTGNAFLRALVATMPGLWLNGRLFAVPDYAKKILEAGDLPWNKDARHLHIKLMTTERFTRKVIRL